MFLIGVTIYTWVPALLAVLERRRPGTAARILRGLSKDAGSRDGTKRIPRPGVWLALAASVALALASQAPKVGFELNTRALMVEDNRSVLLQDEINHAIKEDAVFCDDPDPGTYFLLT